MLLSNPLTGFPPIRFRSERRQVAVQMAFQFIVENDAERAAPGGRDPRDFVLVEPVELRVVFCLAGFYETVVHGLGVWQAGRVPNKPLARLRQSEDANCISFARRDAFFRQNPLMLQAAHSVLHSAGMPLVSET